VHLTWENEAHFEVREAKGELEIVNPPLSIRAEPRVAVVDANVDRNKTRDAAEAYLKFLYTDEAQETFAKNFYRPSKPEILRKYSQLFQPVELFTIQQIAANWDEAEERFFATGGVYDQIVNTLRK
jgi:ABC-type sulfate transport system substrate-binding protein